MKIIRKDYFNMIRNVKIDRIDGSDLYITINCFEDPTQRIPIRRIEKPPHKGDYEDPIVVIDGTNWPNFVEYVSKHLKK